MAHISPSTPPTLYVWPKLWQMPSFDPYCLAALLFCQLSIPGEFTLVECTDVDLSPSGQLPFLVHGQEVITSFSAIVKYISGLAKTHGTKFPRADTEKHLAPLERSQRNAWIANAEASLGDLVASAFYAPDNWDKLVHKEVAALLPIPTRYYVPQKMRAAYFPRLDAAGLWSESEPAVKDTRSAFAEQTLKAKEERAKQAQKEKGKSKFKKTFEKDKFIAKARKILDVYDRLLDGKSYVFHDRISAVDVVIASRILLLVNPPFLDDTLKKLVNDSYPSLVAHAQRVRERVLGSNNPPLLYQTHQASLWSLIPVPTFWQWRKFKPAPATTKEDESEVDKHAAKMRWAFVGLTLGGLAAYMALVLPQVIEKASEIQRAMEAAEIEEEEEDDDDEDEDE